MAKKHPSDTAKYHYRLKPPSVWRAIRAEWEAGVAPIDLARRYDVGASTVSLRREREGWSREGMLERLAASTPSGFVAVSEPLVPALPSPGAADGEVAGAGPGTRLVPLEKIDALLIAETALRASLAALDKGRAVDALALIKAGDAVGAFADFTARLRAGDGGRAGAAGAASSPAEPTPDAADGAEPA